jgi:hypothetical protein
VQPFFLQCGLFCSFHPLRSALLLALALPRPCVCRERYPSVVDARVLLGVAQAFGASAGEGMKRRGFVRFGAPSERDAALREVWLTRREQGRSRRGAVCLVPCGGPGLGGWRAEGPGKGNSIAP